MAKPVFFTKAGWLTAYAHACGYRHIETINKEESIILEGDSGNFTVTHWRRDAANCVNSYGATLRDGIAAFEGFSSLPAARAFYRQRVARPLSRRYESNSDVARHVYA